MSASGRPKMPIDQLSNWGKWKRLQRASPGGKTGGGRCARCGKVKPNTNMHHKDVNKSNDSPGNIDRICDACHPIIDKEVIHSKVAKSDTN